MEEPAKEFHVGEDGEFLFLDHLGRPAGTIKGKIVFLSDLPPTVYALIKTDSGFVSVRLK